MGEFVEIKDGVSGILSAAQSLVRAGDQLSKDVGTIQDTIRTHENKAETFPSDQFTDEFRKTYDNIVPTGPHTSAETHIAIPMAAKEAGETLAKIGHYVGKSMMAYSAQDDANATDIENPDTSKKA
jgi:conjugal transfer/entry exclusion protein